ncbi:hypothetical protein B0H14DRAFT_2644735 [Mycena olivaceomarginata]|nr:hypothetical protein B0H14DRAFT_2644735 [Mycena olivaceomarginata]
MALRVKSVDCELNVGWEAATQGELHTTAGDNRLTLPACDEVWFNDRALFSLQTVTHWVGGASGTSRGLMVVEERNVLFVSFRNPGDQTKLFPHAHPEFSIKLTNFPIPKRSNEVTKMGTTRIVVIAPYISQHAHSKKLTKQARYKSKFNPNLPPLIQADSL